MSVRRTIRRAWEAYRLLRVASYAAGALAGAGGLAGAYWTLLARRLRTGLAEDSPECLWSNKRVRRHHQI